MEAVLDTGFSLSYGFTHNGIQVQVTSRTHPGTIARDS